MAQIVKLRRSSVSGQKPTNSNLQLGELALNTTDGKVFMAVSGSGGPSVEELITTNTVNTGSLYLTGDITASNFLGTSSYSSNSDKLDGKDSSEFATTGSNTFKGDQIVTGSLITTGSNKLIGNTQLTGSLTVSGSTIQIGDNTLAGTTLLSGSITISGSKSVGIPTVKIYGDIEQDGYTRYLPVNTNLDTNISGSYIFVSGSTDDLYFSQNGKGYSNVTRLRWLEGNLYTGLLNGGNITATVGGTTFNVSAGSGIVVNLNASITDNPYPAVKYVNWESFTGQTLTYRTTDIQTFVGIDSNGQIVQQTGAFNDGQYNNIITLGSVIHQNLSTVNASINYPNVAYGYKQRTYDFIKAFGPLKLSGLNIVPVNTLGLNVGSGTAWADGRNYQVDPNNPSYITDSGTAVSKIFRYYQVSGTTFVQDTNNASGYTTLDVTHYNNNGTLTDVPGNNVNNYEWTIQRIFWYPNSATKGIVAYYGNRTYTSSTEAAANVQFEPFVEVENTKQNAVYLGAIAVRKDATWADSTTFLILPGGVFRNVGGSGGGGSVPTGRLTDLTDVDVAGASNGDLVSYNGNSLKWEHGKQLTGDYQITGSLKVTNGISGSIDYVNITNKPTLVSGSSQIEITGTTGYSTFSSSIATTTNNSENRLNAIETSTGSLNSFTSSINTTIKNKLDSDGVISGSIQVNITGTTGYSTFSSSIATTDSNQDNRLNSLETSTSSLNSFTSSINTTIKNKLNSENVVSGSIQVELTGITGYSTFSSSIATTTNNVETRIGSLETESGSIRSNFNSFTSSYNTGSFTGSFKGDGSGLYNVPASGVTGLQLDRIVNGAVSASLESGDLKINTNLDVHGNVVLGGEGVGHLLTIKALLSSSLVPDSDNDHYIGGPLKKWKEIYVTTGSIDYINTIHITNANVSGTFTGSHIGDGSGLYNIPASGVTGLQLDKIINGNASASIDDSGFYINRDVYVDGILTAKELHIDYVTSSVLYQSGSTKFGDTSDDTHTFTGSVLISGSIVSTDTTLVSGSSQINITGTTGYSTFSSSIATTTNNVETRVGSLETESGSIRSTFNTFTSSYTTGSFTGSFGGNATNLTNVPFHITGSDIFGNTVDKTFTKLQFDDSTGLNVEETDPGTAFISIGSHFKDIFVSGSPILSATGSDAFEIIPEGGIDITTSITDTNGNGYIKELKISALSLSSSLDTRINTITGSLNGVISNFNSFTSSTNTHLSGLDTFTSSVVLISQTGSMSVMSASYALTAAFALNANAGSSEGRTARLDQTSASTTWTFNHNLGEQYPTITVYDSNDDVVIPSVISADSANTITITFPSAQSGHVVATVGGGLPYLSGSYDGYVLAGVSNAPTWKGGMVSGSLQITNLGFAATGSNTFVGDQTIEGTLTIRDAQFKQFTTTGITVGNQVITTIPNGLYDGAYFDYVVKNGSNKRIGTVMATWEGSNVVYNEVSTTDIGNTSAVVMSVTLGSGIAELRATISSGTWDFKTLTRGI